MATWIITVQPEDERAGPYTFNLQAVDEDEALAAAEAYMPTVGFTGEIISVEIKA